jgi:hypothetical protein
MSISHTPEMPVFEPSETKAPPSEVAYYHDQKGRFHPPEKGPASYARVMEVHKDAEEELAETSEELERFREVYDIVKDDERGRALLADLVEASGAYLEIVTRFNVFTSRMEKEGEEYRATRERLDRLRTARHEVVISNLKAFQRYVRQHYGADGDIDPHLEDELPVSIIYTGRQSDRVAIGRWAMRLAAALAKNPGLDFGRSKEAA